MRLEIIEVDSKLQRLQLNSETSRSRIINKLSARPQGDTFQRMSSVVMNNILRYSLPYIQQDPKNILTPEG
jgi:hypothetical protein